MNIAAVTCLASLYAGLIFGGTVASAQIDSVSKSRTIAATSKTPKKLEKTSKAKPRAKPPRGVVARFSQGMNLFNSGKFEDALSLFSILHREFPGHEPTIIQYAKTLYRLDRIPESYNVFTKINPQYLDPETSYEYGYAFFIQNHFDGALYSFQRVPGDHPLYDLANYYGAMCAIRLKKYALAEELLDKAVVLPDKLARSKNLYQRHVASLRQLQEKSDIERYAIDEKQRITNENARAKIATSSNQNGGVPAPVPAAAGSEKYIHKGFYPSTGSVYPSIGSDARLISETINESSDLHGYARRSYTQKSGAFQFRHNPIIEIPFKNDKNRSAALGATLNLAVKSITIEGKKERLVANEDTADIVQTLTETQPRETTNIGDISGLVWAESPIFRANWIGADAHLGFSYPNFARGQRYGYRGVSGHVGWKNNDPMALDFKLSGTYNLFVDSETEPVTSQTVTSAVVSASTPSGFAGNLGAKYILYNYKIALLPGPDTSTSGSAGISQSFPLGISISLKGIAEQQDNYIARNLPISGTASASGQILTGAAALDVAPVSWLTVSLSHTRSKSTWKVTQAARKAEFMAATPDYVETSVLTGSINFVF